MQSLKSHIQQVRGVSYKSGQSLNEAREGYLPVLRSNNIEESALNFDNLVYVPSELIKNEQKLRKGDILITASTGSIKVIGKNGYVNEDYEGSFGAFCKVVRPLNTINPEYLKHFFQSRNYRLYIRSVVNGANINNIKTSHIDELKIPLPPLDQQKQIAQILDMADAYRQKTKALIEKYDQLTQSLFLDMFGDPVTNPNNYNTIVASEYYGVRGRVGWKGYKKTDLRPEGAIVLGATHITKSGDIDLSKVVYLSQEKFDESPEIVVQKNDLIFVQRGNTIGKVGLVRQDLGDATINPVVLIFRPKNANPLFLLYLLMNKRLNREFVNSNSGSAQPMITQKFMKEFVFIDVPIEEQNQFAERVQAIEAQKELSQQELDKAEELFNSLLQKAFKGELV